MKYAQGLPVADQVINWLLLLRSGRATPQDYNDFLAWRAADPLHENAWQQLIGTLEGSTFGRLGDAYPIAAASPSQPAAPPPSRFTFAPLHDRRLGVRAPAPAHVGNAFYPSTTSPPTPPRPPANAAATLSDGSQLLLDARSRVNLDFTPAYRQVRLLDGAVTVSVAPDAPPLPGPDRRGTVRALGTRYMVRQQAQRTVVVVHEHEVEVETMSGAHGTVRAGTGARFDALRMDTPRATDGRSRLGGWLDRRARPAAGRGDRGAAPLPQRLAAHLHGCGRPAGVGTLPLDDTDAALRSLGEHAHPYPPLHPWYVSINVAT